MESEVATMNYVAAKTSIPVARVLYLNLQTDHPLGVHMLLEKVPGVKLSTIFPDLTGFEQDLLVGQIARWTIELFRHRFDAIGSLYSSQTDEFHVGPIVRPSFYVDGRDKLMLDRGPFSTTREYFIACAQREIDSARTQSAQDTSDKYQRDVEDARFTVERSMVLLLNAIQGCRGLDDEDPELSPFSLSLTDLDLSKIYVSATDSTHIVSLPVWYAVSTRPLWHCASLPSWLTTTLSEEGGIDKSRLEKMFRKVVQEIEGPDGLFLRTLDLEDTRRAIDDVCEYDAFKDGFLILPTLESIVATLPGEEDVAGLQALLDPNTLEGRAARIALLTRGTGTLSLATRGEIPFERGERPMVQHLGSGLVMV
ncbi:hypothetical protein K439DRAFT_1545511 [Ramaria rubella]|nr:hypothetical protein K439DRAFT_1545511 [Ramaria rubella]